jgi:hypothetical protein
LECSCSNGEAKSVEASQAQPVRDWSDDRIAWQADNPSIALKAYINIVNDRGVRMR